MPISNNTYYINLTAGGGAENLDVTDPFTLYNITSSGSVTLTSNWTIQPNGTPSDGTLYHFKYQADIDLDGNTITIFGKQLPETLADKTHTITAMYVSGAWEVDFHADLDEDGSIPLTMLSGDGWKPMPTTTETMMNGDDSPNVINSAQAEGTTNSTLYYKLDPLSNTVEVAGVVEVNSVDETSVTGSLSVSIFSFTTGNTPALGLSWEYPLNFKYIPDNGPEDIVSGYITKSSTLATVSLDIPSGNLGTDTDAIYSTYINIVIPYS